MCHISGSLTFFFFKNYIKFISLVSAIDSRTVGHKRTFWLGQDVIVWNCNLFTLGLIVKNLLTSLQKKKKRICP